MEEASLSLKSIAYEVTRDGRLIIVMYSMGVEECQIIQSNIKVLMLPTLGTRSRALLVFVHFLPGSRGLDIKIYYIDIQK